VLLPVAALSAGLLAVPGAAIAAQPQGHGAVAPPVVMTTKGAVAGTAAEAMNEYLGIPYAAPPVGALRWRPPQPPAAWSGVRQATAFAPECPQAPGGFPPGSGAQSEDCLYLNVFVPQAAGRGRLPVMVWMPGGANVSGDSAGYDPARLAARGVIVVTMDYRLGVLGFLAHPALTAEQGTSGDYGLMDQQAALRWVRQNIDAFGGNSDNVTLFGESAGGYDTIDQLASPLARGLFQKAIVESGSAVFGEESLSAAEAQGQQAATAMGCTDQSLACMRAAPVSAVLAATAPSSGDVDIDGTVLPQPVSAGGQYPVFSARQFNHVPVMIGTNHDELRILPAETELATGTPLTAAGYVPAIEATFALGGGVSAQRAQQIADAYPLSAYGGNPSIALGAAATDALMVCPSLNVIQGTSRLVPTYQYEFADENAPGMPFLSGVSFPLGAYHGAELQYLFEISGFGPLDLSQQQLSAQMVGYWTQFAKTSNPNSAGLPAWPESSAATQRFQSLLPPGAVTASGFNNEHKCSSVWGY
jgi:para-nitrobenzyl esterase